MLEVVIGNKCILGLDECGTLYWKENRRGSYSSPALVKHPKTSNLKFKWIGYYRPHDEFYLLDTRGTVHVLSYQPLYSSPIGKIIYKNIHSFHIWKEYCYFTKSNQEGLYKIDAYKRNYSCYQELPIAVDKDNLDVKELTQIVGGDDKIPLFMLFKGRIFLYTPSNRICEVKGCHDFCSSMTFAFRKNGCSRIILNNDYGFSTYYINLIPNEKGKFASSGAHKLEPFYSNKRYCFGSDSGKREVWLGVNRQLYFIDLKLLTRSENTYLPYKETKIEDFDETFDISHIGYRPVFYMSEGIWYGTWRPGEIDSLKEETTPYHKTDNLLWWSEVSFPHTSTPHLGRLDKRPTHARSNLKKRVDYIHKDPKLLNDFRSPLLHRLQTTNNKDYRIFNRDIWD